MFDTLVAVVNVVTAQRTYICISHSLSLCPCVCFLFLFFLPAVCLYTYSGFSQPYENQCVSIVVVVASRSNPFIVGNVCLSFV